MKEYKIYRFPLAISVVISGLYEDDKDNLEDVTYTGQGGNNLLGNKHQVKDQELKTGNLALKVWDSFSLEFILICDAKHNSFVPQDLRSVSYYVFMFI